MYILTILIRFYFIPNQSTTFNFIIEKCMRLTKYLRITIYLYKARKDHLLTDINYEALPNV